MQIKEEVENIMGNINESCLDLDIKNPEIVESYDARNNYFYLEQSIVKIQRSLRQYVRKKNETISMVDSSRSYSGFSTNSFLNYSKTHELTARGLFLLKKKQFKYQGYFTKSQKKHGFGIVKWEDGSKLYSIFDNNKTNGIARFIDESSQVFIGEYVNNRPYGYGIYLEKNEVNYEGYWVNNNLDSYGIESWKDGTTYKGKLCECKKEGIGTYRWPDGTEYQGEWKNDKMEGYGILTYSDQRKYEGEIKDGYMHGYGMFLWPDGKKFFGQYRQDVKEGFGVFIWSVCPLQAFVGFWSQGKQNGIGIKISELNVKYGIWKKGVKEKWLRGPWELRKNCPINKKNFLSLIENGYQNIIDIITT